MQQIVIESNRQRFTDAVNEHLMAGWRVVPGTMFVTAIKSVPFPNTPPIYIGPKGLTYERVWSIVLENDEK